MIDLKLNNFEFVNSDKNEYLILLQNTQNFIKDILDSYNITFKDLGLIDYEKAAKKLVRKENVKDCIYRFLQENDREKKCK